MTWSPSLACSRPDEVEPASQERTDKATGCVVRRATCRALALGGVTDSTGRTRKASQKGGTLARGLKGGVGVCQMKQVRTFSAEKKYESTILCRNGKCSLEPH